MPEAEHDALQRRLRQEHPDWSQEKIDHVVYGHMVNEGWRPKQRQESNLTPPEQTPGETPARRKWGGLRTKLSDAELLRRLERGKTRKKPVRFKD